MPSWKKIITSGSLDASLGALFVTNAVTSSIFSGSRFIGASFTGSLFGSSSFAVSSSRAVTSSFALTSSFISTTGTNAFIQGGNSFGATAIIGTNDAQNLVLESNGTARVTLDSSGNTSIATGYQFTSAGTLNWGTSAYTIGQLTWDAGGGVNNYAAVFAQGIYNLKLGTTTYPNSIFITGSNGNVGIGTTSPIYKLHSSGIINSDGGYVNSQATFTKSYSLGNIAANTTYTLGQLDFGTVYTHHFKVRVSSYAGTKTFDFIGYQAGLSKTVSGVPYQQDRFNSLDVVLEKIVDGSNQITGVKIGIKNGSSGEDYIYSATIECLSVFSNWTPLASNTTLTTFTPGTSNYIIAEAGNVGIGTTSPTQQLQTTGDAIIRNSYIGYISSFGTDYASFSHTSRTGSGDYSLLSDNVGITYLNAKSGQNLRFRIDNIDKAILDSNGNFGIGTTSPYEKLEVAGAVSATGASAGLSAQGTATTISVESGVGYLRSVDWGSEYKSLVIEGQNISMQTGVGSTTSRLTINSSGNVGIGTTSPATQLHLSGSADIRMSNNANSTGYDIGLLGGLSDANAYVYQRANAALILGTNNTDRIRILGNGNVGIGATSPGALLQIGYQNSGTSEMLRLGVLYTGSPTQRGTITWHDSVDVTGQIDTRYDGSKVNMYFGSLYNSGYNSTVRLTILGDGNVGIGTTTPTEGKLVIANSGPSVIYNKETSQGVNSFWNSSDGSQVQFGAASAHPLLLFTNNSEKVRITSDGNVGINTTSPGYKLDVAGTTGVTTQIRTDGADWITGLKIQTNNADGGYFYTTFVSGSQYASLQAGDNSTYRNISLNHQGGNVGIGITTPATKLHIQGGHTTTLFRLYSTGGDGTGGSGPASVCMWASEPGLTYNGSGIGANINNSPYYGRLDSSNGQSYIRFTPADIQFYTGAGDASFRATILSTGRFGIGTTSPQKPFEVISDSNDFVSVGVNQIASGSWTGIHFGYREANNSYRKSAIVFERTDLTSNDAQGKVHILNGPQGSSGNATLSDARLTIGESGNVGIGTRLPTEKLQVDGTIVTDYTIADTQGYRLIKPKNGTYITQTTTVTGAIKITYPVGYTNTMHTVKVKVYEYETNESFTITFGGYNYDPSPAWFNCFAYIEGNPAIDRNFNVRFGYDGTYMVVYIGELASTWTYPQVFIEEVGLGYSGVSSTWRNNNWGVGFEASAFSNVTATISNTAAHTFVRDGANAYYSLGSIGIGASSPAYKLDVLGTIRATGDVIAYSDARVKDNIQPIENALEKVISLRGVSYNRKDTDDKSRKIGVIAQEVLPIIPEVVSKDQNGNYSVSYGNMVGLLIEAVKEQQKQIEELKYLLENKKKKK